MEFNTTLTQHWFHTNPEWVMHPPVETICGWYRTAREHDANFLLNVGPNRNGKIPEYNRYYLVEAGKKLRL